MIFGGKLGGESFVMRDDQGGFLGGLDQLGHRVGLAGAGDAEDLHLDVVVDAVDKFGNGLGLVAGGPVIGNKLEWMSHRE